MALEPLRQDRSRQIYKQSLVAILLWVVWMLFASALPPPLKLKISGAAFVLVFGAFWWKFTEAVAFLLLMSFIYRAFSLTPSGFYFVCLLIIFLFLRLISQRFSLRSPLQLALTIFLTALSLDLLQMILLSEIMPVRVFAYRLVFSILISAFLQMLMSFAISKPFLIALEKK